MRLGVNGRFLAARPTGVQRFAREILRALCDRVDVVLLLPRGVRPPAELADKVREIPGRLGGRIWEQLELPAAARRAGADVVLHPANALPRFGGPHVVVLHDVLPLTRPADFTLAYRLWARYAHVGAARRAAAVATVSAWSADHLAESLRIPRDRIVVVSQGAAPLDHPASPEAIEAARARFGLERPFFLAVGVEPRKGASFLEDTWRAFVTDSDPILVVAGRAHGAVHSGSSERPDRSGVLYLGHLPDEDLRALMTGSLGLLYPSMDEGFGRPPLEALACGTRVVAAPYGPAREVLGDAADIVPVEPAAWAAAIRAVAAEEPGVRADRIRSGRSHAGGFNWDDGAEQLVEICRAAATGSP